MVAPNGMQPGGGAPYGLGAAVMPSAGHHQDMQHVWTLVEELSSLLEQNRQRYEELQASLAAAKIHPQDKEKAQVNGDGQDHSATESITELSAKLVDSERKVEALEGAYTEQAELVTAYENGMLDTSERLRNYVFEQQQATNALHAHYNALLETSRNETLQAQLTHQAWQASLSRVAEGVRLAYREESDKTLPYRKRIAALKEENRILRRKAGWDPPEDFSDDEPAETVPKH